MEPDANFCLYLLLVVAPHLMLLFFFLEKVRRGGYFRRRQSRSRILIDFCVFLVKNKKGIEEIHTKLYSRKLSCRIVSLTAANTKRIFSVSVTKTKMKN